MISARDFVDGLTGLGYGPFVGVPCSILTPVINYVLAEPGAPYYAAADEGSAMGIAAGMALADNKPVVMMQNSGLANAINPLTSLHLIFGIPCLMIVSWRGRPGETDAPQHGVMGPITRGLLDVMGIESIEVSADPGDLTATLKRIDELITSSSRPAALILPKGAIEEYPVGKDESTDRRITRQQAVGAIASALRNDEVIVSTTGKISRELYFHEARTRPAFYSIGSMGCASSIAMGIAVSKPGRKVVVLDGDGALLMKMGALATIGHYRPENLIHIVLDNGCYDSTGGQATVMNTVQIDEVADNCGYTFCMEGETELEIGFALNELLDQIGPSLLWIRTAPGDAGPLGRPEQTPVELKDEFRTFLNTDLNTDSEE
ncbi:MAG: phosphonopyruvate decarboxylase [Planctomycetes bacterium]|nr:phosphonopyruvate decarboxylase [Planctomycetota bacterium]